MNADDILYQFYSFKNEAKLQGKDFNKFEDQVYIFKNSGFNQSLLKEFIYKSFEDGYAKRLIKELCYE